MCFVFIFIQTESSKLKIYQEIQERDKIQIEMFIQDIKQNPDIVTNYLRNERILKAQKKQSHARILLNNAF